MLVKLSTHFTKCAKEKQKNVKITFLDKIFSRTLEIKIVKDCALSFISENNISNFKIHNRYIFREVLGCYEILSVLICFFTLFQLYFSYKKFLRLLKKFKPSKTKNTIFLFYGLYFFFVLCTCLGSICLHTHENDFTNMLDYFPVIILTVYCSFLFSIRSLFLIGIDKNFIRRVKYFMIYALSGFLLSFLAYSTYVFDKSLHKTVAGVFIAIFQLNLCLQYFLIKDNKKKKNALKKSVIFCFIACVFECWDFPPFFHIIDSHSLWHANIGIFFKYQIDYLLEDIKDMLSK